MLWEDVLVQCQATDDTLASAIAGVFGLEPDSVLIVDAIDNALVLVHDGVPVLVERSPLSGAFRLHLSLFLRDPQLADAVHSREATLETLRRLAAQLGCPVLTGDESLDPSAWLLIQSSGEVEPATLDVRRLDDDQFVSLLTPHGGHPAPAEASA